MYTTWAAICVCEDAARCSSASLILYEVSVAYADGALIMRPGSATPATIQLHYMVMQLYSLVCWHLCCHGLRFNVLNAFLWLN